MKIYLVGGAVRDRLLNYPVKERDWVVVGATPELMLQKGYQQVGRDFPVFLHPTTHEEYALARKERKSAPGYYGFECDISKAVTLEDDLARRDLTINAIAMDESGNIIDPYHGLRDLNEKKLRHVSDAFIEDPVRVLRVARFAARYYHLGFSVAEETRKLMYQMTQRGELTHLVPERVWQELQRSLEEKNPEIFFTTLRACGALKIILPELDRLFGVPNPPQHHPEVDSGVHTLLVLQAAVAISPDPMIRFAALVHDLGKGCTPQNDWPSHRGHEEIGASIIESLCARLRIPVSFRQFAVLVSRFHLLIHRIDELRAKTIVKVLEQTDAFRRPQQFAKLLIACEADAQGRLRQIDYHQSAQWRFVLDECLKVSVQTLIEQGYQGVAIKHELYARRVACVDLILNSWKKHEKQ
ncbi:MAG: multifunctional CCA addition/repair protein [Legionella sp.]|nr:multifunctional CCA addition/repair protein [Legionella sp.]